MDMDGKVTMAHETAIQLPALSATKVATMTDADLFKGADP